MPSRFGVDKLNRNDVKIKSALRFIPLGSSSSGFFCLPVGSLLLVLAVYSSGFEKFFRVSFSLDLAFWSLSVIFLFEKSCFPFSNRYFWRCMNSIFAIIAVGLDAARIAFSKSKIEKTAAAVVGVVGIGLLLAPLSVLSNDVQPARHIPPAPPNDAPEVSCIWVSNHGSSGFSVKFDVHSPSGGRHVFSRFVLTGPNAWDSTHSDPGELSSSSPYPWLAIPGFDGGPPVPYSGYLHSMDYKVKGQELKPILSPNGVYIGSYHSTLAFVNVTLYVVLNSNGSLYSMHAWASDSDGDGYEVSVYYSAGGGSFTTLP